MSGRPTTTLSPAGISGSGAEDGVAQARGLRLHDIGDRRAGPSRRRNIRRMSDLPGEMTKQILSRAAADHALDEIFADGARALGAAVEAAADRQQLLGEGERLDAAAAPGGGNDAPHGRLSSG